MVPQGIFSWPNLQSGNSASSTSWQKGREKKGGNIVPTTQPWVYVLQKDTDNNINLNKIYKNKVASDLDFSPQSQEQ